MKSSLLPPQLLKIFAGTLFAVLFIAPGWAQDTVIMKTNQERTGEVLSVANRTLRLKSGPAEATIPLDQVLSVTKAPPAEFKTAQDALKAGNYAQALPALKTLTEKFLGLPSPWAEEASVELGDIYIGLNQIPEAEKAYTDFQKAYPQSSSLANIGLAQLAVAKKNYPDAKAKLEPILAEAAQVPRAEGIKGANYGRAYYLMGEIRQAEGDNPGALRDYLTTVTIFNQNPMTTAKALEKANLLRKQKSVSVP
ncbi:MAG: tetratricopeptide repeat protein [Chthoniobacterales bacterium]